MKRKAERPLEPRFLELTETVYSDRRGWAAFPWDGLPELLALDPSSLHVVMTLPGRVRGNHLHPEAGEWLYVFAGQAEFVWSDDLGVGGSRLLSGHQTLVYIPPGLAHAVIAVGEDPMWLVAVRDEPRRPTPEHTRSAPLVDARP